MYHHARRSNPSESPFLRGLIYDPSKDSEERGLTGRVSNPDDGQGDAPAPAKLQGGKLRLNIVSRPATARPEPTSYPEPPSLPSKFLGDQYKAFERGGQGLKADEKSAKILAARVKAFEPDLESIDEWYEKQGDVLFSPFKTYLKALERSDRLDPSPEADLERMHIMANYIAEIILPCALRIDGFGDGTLELLSTELPLDNRSRITKYLSGLKRVNDTLRGQLASAAAQSGKEIEDMSSSRAIRYAAGFLNKLLEYKETLKDFVKYEEIPGGVPAEEKERLRELAYLAGRDARRACVSVFHSVSKEGSFSSHFTMVIRQMSLIRA